MKVSTSSFYAWQPSPVRDRDLSDAVLTNAIVDIHWMSRRSNGSPRVHAELRLGQDNSCSRERVERLMREAGIQGIYRRKDWVCTRRDPAAEPADDLVRQPPEGTTVTHSDHASQYTSSTFGRRLRGAGLLGSMGSIGDCFDDGVAESFFGTLQLELLDEHRWTSRQHLALAIFDWIEAWYNPKRRHSYCKMLSPIDYETVSAT